MSAAGGVKAGGRSRAVLLVCFLGTACLRAAPSEGPRPEALASAIDTLALRAYTYFLSHDLLAGRGTGTPGAHLAAVYIASVCRELGLAPVGPDFFQNVPLVAHVLDSASLTVRGGDATRRFEAPADFVPDFAGEQALVDFAGPAVYGGSPMRLGELPDVHGAVVVTAAPVTRRVLLDSLRLRGAVALLQLVPDSSVFDLYRRSRGRMRATIAEPGVPVSLLPALPWVIGGPRLSQDLAAALPAGGDTIGPLGRDLSLRLAVRRRPVRGRNVACLVRGATTGARDSAIVLAAHYDHLGVGPPNARGDSIYNGFSDNAAGVAMVLAIARAMVRGGTAPRHSVILLFPTGEELGLLGSDYYVAHPLWPLSRTLGAIVLDAGAPPAPSTSWRIAGGDTSRLGALAVDVALTHGWSATTSPAKPNTDYYPFARRRVPAIFIVPGPAPYEGLTSDSSAALRRRWDHYHDPADEWTSDFPFAGLRRYAAYALLVVRALDRGGPQ